MSTKNTLRVNVSLCVILFLAGCSEPGTNPPEPVVDRIEVSPAFVTLAGGLTQQLTAKAIDETGNVVAGVDFSWVSDAETVATVDEHGLVTAVIPGSANIYAAGGGKIGFAGITVPIPTIASITLVPNFGTFEIGSPFEIVAVVRDINGAIVIIPLVWRTNSSAVATVSTEGIVTPISTGPVRITATAGDVVGIADFILIPPAVANVIVTPKTVPLIFGETAQLSARVEGSHGEVLTNRAVIWRSRNVLIADVSNSGLVSTVSPGEVWIVAESEGISDSAKVTISQRPVASYELEIVNRLLLPAQVAINGSGAFTVSPGSTIILVRTPEPTVRVAWAIQQPTETGMPIGEAVTDTFPQAVGADGSKIKVEIDATLTDGRRIFTPALTNISASTVLVSFTAKVTALACSCILPNDLLETMGFGYWMLPAGQTMRLHGRGDPGRSGPFLSIPVPPADVNLLTGLWRYTVAAGP